MAADQTVTRIAAGFLLDQVRRARGPLDLTDALILLAVTQANVDPICRDPALQLAYACYDSPPPEHLRRPISVNAVAASLGVPFETARRRLSRLAVLGACRSTPAGFVVPTTFVSMPGHHRALQAAYERMKALYLRLEALGALSSPTAQDAWTGAPPLRAAARVSGEYLLRMVELFSRAFGDLLSAAVWLELYRSNSEGLPDHVLARRHDQFTAVRVAAVASRLGLSAETVRRRVAQLVAEGRCEWTGQGVIVAPAFLEQPAFNQLAAQNARQLQRMFAALDRLGVLTTWAPAARSAEIAA